MTTDATTLSTEEIRFERRGIAGFVTLTRAKALNAVNRHPRHGPPAAPGAARLGR